MATTTKSTTAELIAALILDPNQISLPARGWWWTAEGLYHHLVQSGVDAGTTHKHVVAAFRNLSREGLLSNNRSKNIKYFCMNQSAKTVPSDQQGCSPPSPSHINEKWRMAFRVAIAYNCGGTETHVENSPPHTSLVGVERPSPSIHRVSNEPDYGDMPQVVIAGKHQYAQGTTSVTDGLSDAIDVNTPPSVAVDPPGINENLVDRDRVDEGGVPLEHTTGTTNNRLRTECAAPDEQPGLPIDYQGQVGNGYQIVDNYLRASFNVLLFDHHLTCEQVSECHLKLDSFTKMGWGAYEHYSCTGCGSKFDFSLCEEVKSPVIGEGRKYSRQQPILNIVVPLALKVSGINPTQAEQFFGEAALQKPTTRVFKETFQKIMVAVEERSKAILQSNRRALVQAVKTNKDFDASTDILEWVDTKNGQVHKTVKIMGSLDGAGSTRSYNHRITGTQGAVTAFGCAYGKSLPIAYQVDRTACWLCTLEIHKAIRDGDENPSLRKGTHKGPCSNNSIHGPAVSEEFALEQIGENLLVNEEGESLGDDEALFMCFPISDGDSKGAHRLMARQAAIVGSAATGQSERLPCSGHVGKNLGKGLHKIKAADFTISGEGLLESERIKSIQTYIHTHLLKLKNASWDKGEKPTTEMIQETNASIMNVVPHMCGNHRNCKDEELCAYLKLKNSNPLWKDVDVLTDAQEEELNRRMYDGKTKLQYVLGLNAKGMAMVQAQVKLRYNIDSVAQIARLVTCNENENSWGHLTKFSQGKRLNQNYSKAWESGIQMCLGMKSEPSTYVQNLRAHLGVVEEMPIQRTFRERSETIRANSKKKKKIHKIQGSTPVHERH